MARIKVTTTLSLVRLIACILLSLLTFIRMSKGLDLTPVSRTGETDPNIAYPGYQIASKSLMRKMANDVQYHLVSLQENEWVENLSQDGYVVSGALRCYSPSIKLVTDCQTCINHVKDILTSQFCAPKWNGRVTVGDCSMRFSDYQLTSVDDPDYI